MPEIVNRENLAWAGGFFDGEGSTTYRFENRPNKDGSRYKLPQINITQVGNSEVLDKFKSILGVGKIYDSIYKYSNKKRRFAYSASGFEKTQFVVGMLWNFIGTEKKKQAQKVLRYYLNHMRRNNVP